MDEDYNFDLQELSKTISALKTPKVYRCKYCGCVLGSYDKGKTYCSDWCREMGDERKSYKEHRCVDCNIEVASFPKYKNNPDIPSYVYPKYCDLCKLNHKKIKEKKEYVKKIRQHKYNIDRNGHTCKICKKYKTLDKFPKQISNPKGIYYRCKECAKVEHRLYYEKNKNRLNNYHKEYRMKKKLNLTNN